MDEDDWRRRAACRGEPIELFFLALGEQVPPKTRQLCAGCAVREPCGFAGIGEHGIWGGMTVRERRRLRREGRQK